MIKIKCNNCPRKNIMEYKCRCNLNFCLNCLPHYIHNCNFDYRTNNRVHLEKENPKIISIKVSSI